MAFSSVAVLFRGQVGGGGESDEVEMAPGTGVAGEGGFGDRGGGEDRVEIGERQPFEDATDGDEHGVMGHHPHPAAGVVAVQVGQGRADPAGDVVVRLTARRPVGVGAVGGEPGRLGGKPNCSELGLTRPAPFCTS